MPSANDNLEPRLDEIFAEPIVRQMMARDGSGEDNIRALLQRVANRRQANTAPKLQFVHARPQLQRRDSVPAADVERFAAPARKAQWPRVFPGL